MLLNADSYSDTRAIQDSVSKSLAYSLVPNYYFYSLVTVGGAALVHAIGHRSASAFGEKYCDATTEGLPDSNQSYLCLHGNGTAE
jgi:hypothetical protein